MKPPANRNWKIAITLILSLSSAFSYGATPKSRDSANSTNLVPSVPEVAIPQSSFVIPSQPNEGRNPFYPQSRTAFQAAMTTAKPRDNVVDTSSFVLNGITSPPKRTAMINGRTFEPGESGEVKIPNGAKILIKVEEIRSESAVILVNGQRHEVRLRSGL